jgi:hypothetical protein
MPIKDPIERFDVVPIETPENGFKENPATLRTVMSGSYDYIMIH